MPPVYKLYTIIITDYRAPVYKLNSIIITDYRAPVYKLYTIIITDYRAPVCDIYINQTQLTLLDTAAIGPITDIQTYKSQFGLAFIS